MISFLPLHDGKQAWGWSSLFRWSASTFLHAVVVQVSTVVESQMVPRLHAGVLMHTLTTVQFAFCAHPVILGC